MAPDLCRQPRRLVRRDCVCPFIRCCEGYGFRCGGAAQPGPPLADATIPGPAVFL
ncbi:hypothetical protein T261_2083 [Streptomyces lydicus]|nr:hypothetical protein T261_2083 [Streptomyces lydicus]